MGRRRELGCSQLLDQKWWWLVFSPLSLHVVLSILAARSEGPSQRHLLSFLWSKSTNHLNSFASHLVSNVLSDAAPVGGPRLSVANGVWVEQTLSLKPSFKQLLATHYKATLALVDFQNKALSMRQLHLHVISQDFESKHLKNKKHWNSFNTAFFLDSVYVIDEVSNHGKATLKDDDILSMELRCHRCRSAHPNIPRLKSHISSCQAPFPAYLLENGRLVHAPGKPPNSF